MTNQGPKRHHYVPRFYLQQFAGKDGMLWVFDRQLKQYRRQPPVNTAVQKEYYVFRDLSDEKRYELEKLFAMIEGEAKPVIEKAEQGQPLHDGDRYTLAMFIVWQQLRVPEYQKSVEDSGQKMVQQMMRARFSTKENAAAALAEYTERTGKEPHMTPEEAIDFIYNDRYRVVFEREYSIKMMMRMEEELVPRFLSFDWHFFLAPSSTSYITSDNPFVLLPPQNHDPKGFYEYGLMTPGAEKIFPLSPRVCLVMGDVGGKLVGATVRREFVRHINRAIAWGSYRFVMARDEALLKHVVKLSKVNTKPVRQSWSKVYSPFDKHPNERSRVKKSPPSHKK